MKAYLVIISVFLVAHSAGSSLQSECPADWFTAEFVSIADTVVPSSALGLTLDSNLSFFRNIMMFTDEEIEATTQIAMDFFKSKFGLDFSQTPPDELGQRTIGNATFYPYRTPQETQFTVTFSRWIISGNTKNFCFKNRDGGFTVMFSEDQMLYGTYGGQDGKPISPGEIIVYGFYNIPVCPQEPIVVQYNSATPVRFDPVDGYGIINCDVYHHTLGRGIAQGLLRAIPTGEPDMFHYTFRNLYTFPSHPGLNN